MILLREETALRTERVPKVVKAVRSHFTEKVGRSVILERTLTYASR
jgi:hypothetical protein